MPTPERFMVNPDKPMLLEGEPVTVGMHLIMAVSLRAAQRGTPVMSRQRCLAVVRAAEMLINEMLDIVGELEG